MEKITSQLCPIGVTANGNVSFLCLDVNGMQS